MGPHLQNIDSAQQSIGARRKLGGIVGHHVVSPVRTGTVTLWTPALCEQCSQCYSPSNRQTNIRQGSNLVHVNHKMWHLAAIILMIFLRINWPISCIYLLIQDFYRRPSPKFLWIIALRSSYRMDATDRHKGQTDMSVVWSLSVDTNHSLYSALPAVLYTKCTVFDVVYCQSMCSL